MTTFETTLRRGLAGLGEDTTHSVTPPPVSSIKRRARFERNRSRRLRKGTAIAVAGLVATSGAVAASGVLPGPVESKLSEFRSWGYSAEHGAERMARATYGEMTYEIWRAPLDGGGLCTYQRVTGPDGDIDHGGSSGCDPNVEPAPGPQEFGELTYPGRVARPTATGGEGARAGELASGQLPVEAAAVVFDFADGTSLAVEPQRDRYFITAFPGVPDGTRIVNVRAVDHAGQTVGREHPVG